MEECSKAQNKGMQRSESLNTLCEGFFLVEHILLRPLLSTDYSVSYFDDDKTPFLISFESGGFENIFFAI